MKILVVGMNPSLSAKKNKNSALSRLDSWMSSIGISSFTFTNTVLEPGKVTRKMVDEARIKLMASSHDKVIALGLFSSSVLSDLDIPHFKLPHPSGLNRQLNDKSFIDLELKSCLEYVAK